jgi:ribosomal protein S26
MRGKETLVRCDNCGRTVARNKAVQDEKIIRYGTDMNNKDIKFQTRRTVYYCISCGKHKGIFEKKKEQAIRTASRLQQLR